MKITNLTSPALSIFFTLLGATQLTSCVTSNYPASHQVVVDSKDSSDSAKLIKELLARFDELGLSSRINHLDGSTYWQAKVVCGNFPVLDISTRDSGRVMSVLLFPHALKSEADVSLLLKTTLDTLPDDKDRRVYETHAPKLSDREIAKFYREAYGEEVKSIDRCSVE